MEQRIADFTAYLRNEKKSPENTVLSYSRDLKGFCRFMQEAGVSDAAKVNRTNVMAYVYELQAKKGRGNGFQKYCVHSFFLPVFAEEGHGDGKSCGRYRVAEGGKKSP